MNKNKNWNKNRGGFRGRGGRGRGWGDDRRHFNQDNPGYRAKRFQKRVTPEDWLNRQKSLTNPGKRLSEADIGVTEYISALEGFNGIIKSRYSDFQVAEVNEDGEIAKLTIRKPPQPPAEEKIDEDEDLMLSKYNLEILPTEMWDKINRLAVCEDIEEAVEIDMTGAPKEQRTKIHEAVKKAFGSIIVGSTVTVDDKKFVRFERFRKGVRIDTRVKWMWPAEYVYFIVHKENCDTMEAAVRIAERIGVNLKPSMLGYAGTKDRRAKTSQWFSARRVDPRKLAAACRQLRDISVGNFTFHKVPLKLGMLKGNRFRIALRNVTASEELIDAACVHLREKGFINYYGLQRFGTRFETPTYNIGLKLLQSDYQGAIDAILEPREGPLERALQTFARSGARPALSWLPRHSAAGTHSEARLLRALADAPTDLLGALNKVPRNTRLLYLHSYQSLIWNRVVSARVRKFGLTPAVGDLVPETPQDVDKQEEVEDESDSEEKPFDEIPSESAETEIDREKEKPKKKNQFEPKPKIPVKVLTQEDVDSGRYSIFDIVMPLPGYNIEYPTNMKEYYEELLAKDGLTMHLRHKMKNYCMSGAYRHLAVRPLEVSWNCVRYSDPLGDLIASDLDELQHKPPAGIVEDGKYKALILILTLPPSCYATMALRELLKVDTSSGNQALQNNYHKRQRDSEGTSETENDIEAKKMKGGETTEGNVEGMDSSNGLENIE